MKRGRVLLAAVVGASLATVGLLNATLDLWGRTGGADRPMVVVGHQEVTRALWNRAETDCEQVTGSPPTLFTDPLPGDAFAPNPGEVGADHVDTSKFPVPVWVHPDVIDADPDTFTVEEFVAAGAYEAGEREFRVLLANRTDEQLVVTDLTLDVVRHPVPTGTVMRAPGGDAVSINVIGFDLREQQPVARGVADDCALGEPFFSEYAFVVDSGSNEIFTVSVLPGECLCLIRLTVEYWHQGGWRTTTFPDPDADPVPITHDLGHFDMVYIDNTWLAEANPSYEGRVIEKYDCRQQEHEVC